jgi:hypothetical protein
MKLCLLTRGRLMGDPEFPPTPNSTPTEFHAHRIPSLPPEERLHQRCPQRLVPSVVLQRCLAHPKVRLPRCLSAASYSRQLRTRYMIFCLLTESAITCGNAIGARIERFVSRTCRILTSIVDNYPQELVDDTVKCSGVLFFVVSGGAAWQVARRGVNNVNISRTPCEKSHSNRDARSVYWDTFLNPFYDKRKQGAV